MGKHSWDEISNRMRELSNGGILTTRTWNKNRGNLPTAQDITRKRRESWRTICKNLKIPTSQFGGRSMMDIGLMADIEYWVGRGAKLAEPNEVYSDGLPIGGIREDDRFIYMMVR